MQWSGGDPGTEVKIKLYKGKKVVKTIKASTANDGNASWKVPYSLAAGTNYRVCVMSSDYSYVKDKSERFEIVVPPINVTAPSSGKIWKRCYTYPIKWTGGKPSANVKIKLLKNGDAVKTITASTPNDGLFKWKVPFKTALGEDYSVRVIYLPDISLKDVSPGTFSVINSNKPIGTWTGRWTDPTYGSSGALEICLKKNGTFTGKTHQPLWPYGGSGTAILDVSGTYTYNESTDYFSINIEATGFMMSYQIRMEASGYGTLVNNKITGSDSGTVYYYEDGSWHYYESYDEDFEMNRKNCNCTI
jgi:5-hydroxyisourate hydrolase-like protein (transthyretin family)